MTMETTNTETADHTSIVPKSAICHTMPCRIAYTGPAPGMDTFFNPTNIIDTTAPTGTSSAAKQVIDTSDMEVDTTNIHASIEVVPVIPHDPTFQAAMLRGRGLLARTCTTSRDMPSVNGHVFQVVTAPSSAMSKYNTNEHPYDSHDQQQQQQEKSLQSIMSFDQYVEWYHEHDTSTIPTSTTSTTRYNRAMEWISTADCLHAPLPIPAIKTAHPDI
jgi:Ribonuclease H2 non-catalytic subunit (Ylr154p-like)